VDDSGVKRQREQMLKLVAKAFYRELTNYGVDKSEVLSVANHLLDHVVGAGGEGASVEAKARTLSVSDVRDAWHSQQTLTIDTVSLRPLHQDDYEHVTGWLQEAEVRASFVPPLPARPAQVAAYFDDASRDYFAIAHDANLVGVIGAENVDPINRKLEMKKLIGETALRGKGIGTRATFAFLYHAFCVRDMHKVFVHSRDINVRNLNVNSQLGFELEGILLEDVAIAERHADIVRMALLKPIWLALFG
jgi:RimJ/RimL family protein N-acetyltransferase